MTPFGGDFLFVGWFQMSYLPAKLEINFCDFQLHSNYGLTLNGLFWYTALKIAIFPNCHLHFMPLPDVRILQSHLVWETKIMGLPENVKV